MRHGQPPWVTSPGFSFWCRSGECPTASNSQLKQHWCMATLLQVFSSSFLFMQWLLSTTSAFLLMPGVAHSIFCACCFRYTAWQLLKNLAFKVLTSFRKHDCNINYFSSLDQYGSYRLSSDPHYLPKYRVGFGRTWIVIHVRGSHTLHVERPRSLELRTRWVIVFSSTTARGEKWSKKRSKNSTYNL